MKLATVLTDKNRVVVVSVLVAIIFLPLLFSVAAFAFAPRDRIEEVFLEPPDPRYEACLRDAAAMRYRHMDLLKEARDDAIRRGVRSGTTLSGCADCHANRGQFCNRCHEAVSLTLDCFGCHYYPETAPASGTLGR